MKIVGKNDPTDDHFATLSCDCGAVYQVTGEDVAAGADYRLRNCPACGYGGTYYARHRRNRWCIDGCLVAFILFGLWLMWILRQVYLND